MDGFNNFMTKGRAPRIHKFKTTRKRVLIIFPILLIIWGVFFWASYNFVPEVKSSVNHFMQIDLFTNGIYQSTNGVRQKTPPIDNSKIISLQQINNVGYSFYIGQIDYADATPLSDDIKNNITQVIYKARFPKSLLTNVGIIIVNTLAVSQYQMIQGPTGNFAIPSFSPDFMSGGGIYSSYASNFSFIFINKTKLSDLTDILTHELGHHLSSQLTDAEWTKYYQLRKIPTNTSRQGTSWNLSPMEDFAEVYKNTFTGLRVKTYYGLLVPIFNSVDTESTCYQIHSKLEENYINQHYATSSNYMLNIFQNGSMVDMDAMENSIISNMELQNCRRDVLLHPEKYSYAWSLGAPYYSIVDQATKNFITQVINRLN